MSSSYLRAEGIGLDHQSGGEFVPCVTRLQRDRRRTFGSRLRGLDRTGWRPCLSALITVGAVFGSVGPTEPMIFCGAASDLLRRDLVDPFHHDDRALGLPQSGPEVRTRPLRTPRMGIRRPCPIHRKVIMILYDGPAQCEEFS
ncbi:hypothetical protein [Actinomadura craniellae]|uniref:hypothetical protein n=1 Tax=Actinomadura craniellae TaxID=2231787 RepID=UPI0011BEA804|nr:hypothetical protein [Actinomadura craniellae]